MSKLRNIFIENIYEAHLRVFIALSYHSNLQDTCMRDVNLPSEKSCVICVIILNIFPVSVSDCCSISLFVYRVRPEAASVRPCDGLATRWSSRSPCDPEQEETGIKNG